MKRTIKRLALIMVCIGASGCTHQTLKAPCGPSASLTDPCGDRTPINGAKSVLITDVNEVENTITKKT